MGVRRGLGQRYVDYHREVEGLERVSEALGVGKGVPRVG